MCKEKTGNTSQVQARCKNTTTSATGISRTGGEHLCQQDQEQKHDNSPISIIQVIKQTFVHDMGKLSVQQ